VEDFGPAALVPATHPAPPETPAPGPKQWILKKLTSKHREIISLRNTGISREDVGRLCNCTPEYVTMLIKQPLAQAYLLELQEEIKQDLRGLSGKAVQRVSKTLESGDDRAGLRAAEIVLEANGFIRVKGEESKATTAEDVVAKLFEIHNSNVQVNITPKEQS